VKKNNPASSTKKQLLDRKRHLEKTKNRPNMAFFTQKCVFSKIFRSSEKKLKNLKKFLFFY